MCDLFLNVGGAALGLWQKQEDGTVIYGSLMDGAKEALNMLNDWYNKGIIPADFATWNADTIKQVIGEEKAGIVFSPWWGCWDVLSANINLNKEAIWSAYLLPGKEGDEIRSVSGNPVRAVYVVRKDFSNPEAIVYAYDMMLNGYSIDTAASNFDGISYQTNNTYVPMNASNAPSILTYPMNEVIEKCQVTHEITSIEQMREYIQTVTNGLIKGSEDQYTLMFKYGVPVTDAIAAGKSPREVALDDADEITVYNNYVACTVGIGALAKAQPVPVSTMFQGTTKSMNKYLSFLQSLESDAYIKMIMGNTDGKTIDEYFDSFVADYMAQGGAEITAEVQEILGK